MADLAASIAKARKAGYSDAEIAAYVAKDPAMGPKVATARKAGYNDAQIVAHLGKVSPIKDAVKSFASGVAESAAGMADNVLQASPIGVMDSTLRTAAGIADVLRGKLRPQMANPFSRTSDAVRSKSYKPQTVAGEYARTTGQMTANAVFPGSLGARAANVFAPALVSETAGQIARVSGAGPRGEAVARGVGAVAGGALASVRPQNIFARRPEPTPVETFAQRTRPDPAVMQQRADELRAAGVEPTLVDVSGERGRRMIRAVGVRSEAGGEALTQNANARMADTRPAVMAGARRLNNDPRTANQFADDMETLRGQQASQNYSQFDGDQIEVPDTVRDMLSDSAGRSIIARARADAIENQDWGRQVELDRLLQAGGEGGVGPLPRVSAGTIDRLVIAARERGAAFARRGNNMRARGAFNRRDQLDATLANVEELRPARQTYANQSRAIEVARGENRLDPFSTAPQDYARWVEGLPQEARQANQIAIRQQVLDTLGRQRDNAFGTLDQLASSQYARQNLRSAFGPEADQFLNEIGARLSQARNARFVEPNAGSRTAVLENDVGNTAQEAVGVIRQGFRGDLIGLAARAVDVWRRRGINPQQAEELARIAVDPAQTDAAIQAIAARLQPQQRGEFLSLRNAALIGAAGATTASRPRGPEERQ